MRTWQWMIKPMTISCGFWGAVIGGIISAAGSLWSASENKKSAQKSMDFSEDMSNSAYQRTMADMKKAGLNPILASKVGGASTPQGVAYQTQNPGSGAVSSAMDAERSLSGARLTNANAVIQEAKGPASEIEKTIMGDVQEGFNAVREGILSQEEFTDRVAEMLVNAEKAGGDALQATKNVIDKTMNEGEVWIKKIWTNAADKADEILKKVGIK